VGAKKGFDVAVIDGHGLVAGPRRITEVSEVAQWLSEQRPRIVAVDSPRSPAPEGQLSREEERNLVRAGVCGIRYTPNEAALEANRTYYAWIRNGFKLYEALGDAKPSVGWTPIECFPTATWSRLGGRKARRSRARWSRQVLDGLGLKGLPRRMNQDARDAIGAAITARLYHRGETESFGEIVVPLG
jgi:predicted nuclease with RNAse H fold